MMKAGKVRIGFYLVGILFLLQLMGCGAGHNLTVREVKPGQAVKLTFIDGSTDKGIIAEKKNDELNYVSEADHQTRTVLIRKVRLVEPLGKYYDDLAYPISEAEIEKYKTNRNTWGYALGGAVIGGASGLVVSLPLWLADVNGVPPYFGAGAGAVVGSIYFAFRGQEKDKEIAVQKIRYLRRTDRKLQRELEEEKNRLQKIEEEKKKLMEKLKEKEQKK